METRCVLCAQPTGLRAIGAMIVTGNVERPDGDIVCRHCAALPTEERKAMRDQAMARMLHQNTSGRFGRA